MTAEQRSKLFAIRALMDELIAAIPASDESAFNAAAATINKNAAAIRIWVPEADYNRGDIRVDPTDNVPYWAIHNHGVAVGQIHQPSRSPTIWTHCHGTTPETARPFLAESYNPYMTGHYCTWDGEVKRCRVDNIVYSPVELPYAWEDIE